ncbi:MAG: ATP-grasp domain-containing protein [Clostridia bacterium]|nr:ATP-grasp domain-containing protein [Clostridia bacterium]MBR2287968.1 ATP-grasp domain-containing protein [Clostridia bacterium]
MNFVFISPNFPHTYWQFCDRLHRNGVNVLGIGDSPYDDLESPLKGALTEYYKVGSLENYDEVYRAVAYFAFRYGEINWIESLNEYWLEQDAKLRTAFHVTTGIQEDKIAVIKEKSRMKQVYFDHGIPSARQHRVSDLPSAQAFLAEVGYPVIVKPDIGVGATNTWKLENDADLARFYEEKPAVPYVMEEFVEGEICSYDAISDSHCDILFETMTVWPPVMDIVLKDLDLRYYTCPEAPEKLRELGRKTVNAFGVASRFVHLEFFRLTKARKGLGEVGDFVALEVNMRPAGGYTPDMMNFAQSVDVYQIYADMVTADRRLFPSPSETFYCAYASRKDGHVYTHTHEEIMARYGANMVMQEEMPQMNWPQMGRYMYTAKLPDYKAAQDYLDFVLL